MRRYSAVCTAALAALLSANTCQATLVAPGYTVSAVSPSSLLINGLATNIGDTDATLGGLLGQGALDSALTTDDFTSLASSSPDAYDTLSIAAGTRVAAFQFDVGPGSSGSPFTLQLTFDRTILGVIFQGNPADSAPDTLQAANLTLGADPEFTTAPLFPPADNEIVITAAGSIATISGAFASGSDLDSFMIITSAVPEAGTALVGTLLTGLGFVTIGRRREAAEDC